MVKFYRIRGLSVRALDHKIEGIMSLITHLERFRNTSVPDYVQLAVGEHCFGLTKPELAQELVSYSHVFKQQGDRLIMHPGLDDVEKRTIAIDDILHDLSDRGVIPQEPDYSEFGGTDWFAVHASTTSERLFRIRRFYSLYLGIHFESVILNGFDDTGYWIAERSDQVHFHKSMLDCITAGCICLGETPDNAVFEEGAVECGLRPGDLPLIQFIKKIHLHELSSKGYLRNETFHVYYFKITNDFKPRPLFKKETAEFRHVGFKDLYDLVQNTTKVRPVIRIVIIDFLKRHGFIDKNDIQSKEFETLLAETHDFYT